MYVYIYIIESYVLIHTQWYLNQPSRKRHNSPDSGLILAHWMAWLQCRCRACGQWVYPWRLRFLTSKCDDFGDEKSTQKICGSKLWKMQLVVFDEEKDPKYVIQHWYNWHIHSFVVADASISAFICSKQTMTSKEGAGAWQHRFLRVAKFNEGKALGIRQYPIDSWGPEFSNSHNERWRIMIPWCPKKQ